MRRQRDVIWIGNNYIGDRHVLCLYPEPTKRTNDSLLLVLKSNTKYWVGPGISWNLIFRHSRGLKKLKLNICFFFLKKKKKNWCHCCCFMYVSQISFGFVVNEVLDFNHEVITTLIFIDCNCNCNFIYFVCFKFSLFQFSFSILFICGKKVWPFTELNLSGWMM